MQATIDLKERMGVKVRNIAGGFDPFISIQLDSADGVVNIWTPTAQAAIDLADLIKFQAERLLPQADPMLQPELKVERIA
jgi:hypothetical protein